MPPATHPSASWRASGDRVEIHVGATALVCLTRLDRRVGVGLVMPPMGRIVDISVQPSAACRTLDEAAARAGVAAEAVHAAARAALSDVARRAAAWKSPEGMCLLRAFGGSAFPLLAAAYEAGAAPVGEVPRWAEPMLAARTVGEGATVAFGATATRPVRRALVEAIRPLPTGEVDLAVHAFALMGRSVLQPDRLARVLAAERVLHPSADLPDPATLEATRRVLDAWGDRRTERVLLDAAARADGMRMLMDTARYARQLGDHGPAQPLPNRLAELHDVHRALVRSAADTLPPQTLAPAPAPTGACRARAGARVAPPHHALAPASALRAVPASAPIPALPAIRSLDGREVDDLTLVLPHTAGDLSRWGRLLSSCLGDFGPSAVSGRCTIVGVQRANRLVYAVELTSAGVVRQFCGRNNRAPRDRDRRAVIGALARSGALDTRSSRNRPWLAGVVGSATGPSLAACE